MSSLRALKTRLDKITTQNSSHLHSKFLFSEADKKSNNQSDWPRRIAEAGNKPEDWLDYISCVEKEVGNRTQIERHNILTCIYDKAFKAIPSAENKRNEVYAKLFLQYADLKSEFSPDEAAELLRCARLIVRRFSIVHIAAAEFEIRQGNACKARKILEKARQVQAEPESLLQEAMKNVDAGKTPLTSSGPVMNFGSAPRDDQAVDESLGIPDVTDEIKENQLSPAKQGTTTLTEPLYPRCDESLDESLKTGSASLARLKALLESTKKAPLRHYKSTPECRSLSKNGLDTLPTWKRPAGIKNLGLPMRVKKMSLPFSEKDEDSDDQDKNFQMEIKPLGHHDNGTSHASQHTSGYVSIQSDMSSVGTINDKTSDKTQDFKAPVKYQTPLATSTAHGISINPGEPLQPINITDLSIVEKHKSDMSVLRTEVYCVDELIKETEKEAQGMLFGPRDSAVNVGKKEQFESTDPSVQEKHIDAPKEPSPPVGDGAPDPVVKSSPKKEKTDTFSVGNMKTISVNGNPYYVLKMAGCGGSAKVYQVFDKDKNTRALKCVKLRDAGEAIISSFKNEIHLLKRLQYCKSVIKMYDFEYCVEENKLLVVMEYGETDLSILFKSRASSEEGIEPHMIRFFWKEMLTAVVALHKEGVIHSDLKPANFMLVAGNLRLIDFGIANTVQQDKTSVLLSVPMGTLSYMSPEAIMESFESYDGNAAGDKQKPTYKITFRSDIWSLGCILYNMVYGRTPFQHIRNQLGKLQAITNPKHEIEFPDVTDKNLLDVLKKCLRRDPKSRPTADELLAHPYLTGERRAADSPAPSSASVMKNVILQLSTASPFSKEKLKEKLLQQLENGNKIDLNSLTDTKDNTSSNRNPHDVKKATSDLQCINFHQK